MTVESTPDAPPVPSWLKGLPRVFRHRNYRLFFSGQAVTLMGTWVQTVALSWLVYRLTHSVFLLGLVSFVSQAPIFFITPFAGMIADRHDKRSVFIVTRTLCMAQAAVLTLLTLTGHIEIATIIVLALVLGIITAVETPARQAFTVDMVGREDLRQAIAFNAMMFNLARTVGPAIGGVIVAALGEGLCFLLNTVSFGAVLTSLFLMRTKSRTERPTTRPWQDLKQGFQYVTRHPHIRMVLFLSAICSCFGTSYLALMPAFAQDILHENADGLGYLISAFGVGAISGAILVSRLPERHLALTPTIMAVLLGTSLIAFANTQSMLVALLFVVPTGFAYLGIAVSSNTQVQTLSDDAMLGRVLAFYAMGALGSPPFGALLLGYISDLVGVRNAFMLSGAVCLIAAGISLMSLRRRGLVDFVPLHEAQEP
ncbi:MAG TPA: MFS transporter [Micropepsaceae bacterium]|jgi:MFS family permease|nr:MFS transporter [Micropepsaceae bacterium]